MMQSQSYRHADFWPYCVRDSLTMAKIDSAGPEPMPMEAWTIATTARQTTDDCEHEH